MTRKFVDKETLDRVESIAQNNSNNPQELQIEICQAICDRLTVSSQKLDSVDTVYENKRTQNGQEQTNIMIVFEEGTTKKNIIEHGYRLKFELEDIFPVSYYVSIDKNDNSVYSLNLTYSASSNLQVIKPDDMEIL